MEAIVSQTGEDYGFTPSSTSGDFFFGEVLSVSRPFHGVPHKPIAALWECLVECMCVGMGKSPMSFSPLEFVIKDAS